jgi:hypothetical protein
VGWFGVGWIHDSFLSSFDVTSPTFSPLDFHSGIRAVADPVVGSCTWDEQAMVTTSVRPSAEEATQ